MSDVLIPLIAPGNDPQMFRSLIATGLQMQAAQAQTPDHKKVLDGLAQLVSAPGKLSISIQMDSPVTIDELDFEQNTLNAKVEYTPAQ